MIKTPTALVLFLALASGAGQVQVKEAELAWTLTLSDAGKILTTTWSPTASCVAAATETTVHVIDESGKLLWTWDVQKTSRFIQLKQFSSIAVSPGCDAVVVLGDPGYKYVLAADRDGTRAFFKTVGTPLAAKFDLQGNTIAVVTGASKGYLLSPRLERRWSGRLRDLPISWSSQLPVEAKNVVFAREDVDRLFDALLWGRGVSDSVSDDGQWRAVWNEPVRGPSTALIELWGPGAGGYRGRQAAIDDRSQPRWSKPMGCSGGELTRDGAFVITTGDPDHPEAWKLGDSTACDSGKLWTYVFDRDGNILLTWPPGQDLEEMSAAFLARTGRRLERHESSQWNLHASPGEVAALPESRQSESPGHDMLLVSRGRELRLYRAREEGRSHSMRGR